MSEQASNNAAQVQQVLSTLKAGCFLMYVSVLSEVQDVLLFDTESGLTEAELTHIIRTLAMIRADLRILSKAEI